MANVIKFTRAACAHMFKHFERATTETGEYIEFSNIEIDPERTPMNYNLAPSHPDGQGAFLRQRCGEVQCMNRKDVNVMCSWIVTIPKMMANGDHREEFFRQTYAFLENRYGQENIVSAYVHLDEVTPHIHFAFCPVVRDQKKGYLKVSAKECINRTELKRFHPELDEYLAQSMGERYSGGILNEATKEGNKSIEALKRQSATEMLSQAHKKMAEVVADGQEQIASLKTQKERIESELTESKAEIATVKSIITEERQEVKELRSEKSALKKELTESKAEKKSIDSAISKGEQRVAEIGGRIQALEEEVEKLEAPVQKIKAVQPTKTLSGAIRGVSLEDIENLKNIALKYEALLRKHAEQTKEFEKARASVPSMKEQIQYFKNQKELEDYRALFKFLPEDVQKALRQQLRQNRGKASPKRSPEGL